VDCITQNLLDSLLWSDLPGEKSKLKVRAGRAGGAHITKLGIVGAMILAAAGAAGGGDVWAADIFPSKLCQRAQLRTPRCALGFGILLPQAVS